MINFIFFRFRKKPLIYFILFCFVLIRCANQLPPPGGEEDKVPPEILNTYPQNGTVNFDDDYLEIEFSEYVDKRSVQEAIFISPYIEQTLEFEWTGTTVTINFPEELKPDLTYTITLGTDVVDLNNRNRMKESFTFAFSTGDKIDTKEISGRVFGKGNEGILIFAYKFENETDTLLRRKPNYISQTGINGNYSLKGLAQGNYRVVAVSDQFRDLLFQSEQDEIGIPHKDISLSEIDTLFTNLNFLLFSADTSVSRLVSSVMTDANHILVSFSSEIHQSTIKAQNFYLIDSTSSTKKEIRYAYKGRGKPEELFLVTDGTLSVENNYYLFVEKIINPKMRLFENDFTTITISNKIDTIPPNLFLTDPAMNSEVDFIKPQFKFGFDDAFSGNNINDAISFTDTLGKKVEFNLTHWDDGTMLVTPVDDLKPEKDYIIKIDLKLFTDVSGNNTDSVYQYKFKTISGMDFTGVSGKLLNVGFEQFPILVLENISDENLRYKKSVLSGNFEFTRIKPGKYFLWCFLDSIPDVLYQYGWPEPFVHSERFAFYPDTLDLRARWEVTDVIFNFK